MAKPVIHNSSFTLRAPHTLLEQASVKAQEQGKSLSSLIRDFLASLISS